MTLGTGTDQKNNIISLINHAGVQSYRHDGCRIELGQDFIHVLNIHFFTLTKTHKH